MKNICVYCPKPSCFCFCPYGSCYLAARLLLPVKKNIYIYRKQLEIFLVKMDSSISYLLVQLIPSKVKKPRSKSPLKSWCELVVWKI